MRILIPILFLLSLPLAAQQLKVYKVNGQWRYDQTGPMSAYPITGGIVTDTTQIPDPPTTPTPVDDTTRIDARNAATFVGSWTNGATTEPGWYKRTIAYSNVAGNTATFKFQGTRVELWAEVRSNHGTGTVTIRNGTTIVETKPVSFINAVQQVPVLIYTSPPLQPLTNYSIELKVTQGNNMLDFFVVQNYAASTAGTDPPIPPVDPPVGNLINVSPANAQNVLSTARNATINFLPGTYRLPYTAIDASLNLQATPGSVRIIGTQGSNNDTRATLELIGGSTSGQFVRGLIIDGGNVSNAGLYLDRDNVTLDIRVENHKFAGVWINDCKNIKGKLYLKDNSWCNSSWASGEIVLGGYIQNADLSLEWYTTSPSRGYGLKMLWQNASNASLSQNTLHDVKLTIAGELNHSSNWQNGKSRNIGVEIFGCKVVGILDITGIIKNQISLHPQQSVGQIYVHDFVADTNDTYFLEMISNNVKVENGVVYRTGMLGANFQSNELISNVLFNRVRFVQPNGSAMSYGAVNLVGAKGCSNYRLTNCEIEVLKGFPLTKYMGLQGGVTVDGSNTIKYLQ